MNFTDKTKLTRSDIERMVKPLKWEDFYWVGGINHLRKFPFIQLEENLSGLYDFYVKGIVAMRDVKYEDIPQATTKFLVDLICSALGVEEQKGVIYERCLYYDKYDLEW